MCITVGERKQGCSCGACLGTWAAEFELDSWSLLLRCEPRLARSVAGHFELTANAVILPENETRRPTGMIHHISAVTFAVRDMALPSSSTGSLDSSCCTGRRVCNLQQFEGRRGLREPRGEPGIQAQVVGSSYFSSPQVDVHYGRCRHKD